MKTLEGKTVLLTGANGFIGSHLAARLSAIPGIRLVALTRQGLRQALPNTVSLQADLARITPAFWRAAGVAQVDCVFHLGAFTPKNGSEADRIDRCIDDNIAGTRALLESLPGKPGKIVLASTLDVYAQPEDGEVLSEASKVQPATVYGASKLFCERLVAAWAAQHGCEYAVLRYGHIYGPGEEQYGKLIPATIRKLLAGDAPAVHGDGSALRDYFYVGDAVEATLRASAADLHGEPLNLVRGSSVSLREIVETLIPLTGSASSIDYLRDKPNGKSLRFDNTRMLRILGSWDMMPLQEGLAAEVAAFRKAMQ